LFTKTKPKYDELLQFSKQFIDKQTNCNYLKDTTVVTRISSSPKIHKNKTPKTQGKKNNPKKLNPHHHIIIIIIIIIVLSSPSPQTQ
jgi:hypothetical protein